MKKGRTPPLRKQSDKLCRLKKDEEFFLSGFGKCHFMLATSEGVSFKSEIKGFCGMRWDSMSVEQETLFKKA